MTERPFKIKNVRFIVRYRFVILR